MTIRLHHKPAEKTQIDFCDGLFLTDPVTGNKTLTQFFLGVLPFSSYFFGEFVLDQKLATFIGVQSRMFAYFGGITPYVVVDNLKSGVNKADLYDPDVNPTYCDFANHMGFAVVPARPRKPRDKDYVSYCTLFGDSNVEGWLFGRPASFALVNRIGSSGSYK